MEAGRSMICAHTDKDMATLTQNLFSDRSDRAESDDGWVLASGRTVNTRAGSDTIIGDNDGILIEDEGTLITGRGNDTIIGSSLFGINNVFGISNGRGGTINTGSGADTITGSGGFFGIQNFGVISTGTGNDTITGSGSGSAFIASGGIVNYPLGTINTGDGEDNISGNSAFGNGIFNRGTVNTGDGNDSITGISSSGDLNSDSHGIFNQANSLIDTGEGDDIIVGEGSGGSAIYNDGRIDTGSGSDTVDALAGGFEGFGTISLGSGNDTLKGFGSGNFNGGDGRDRILFGEGSYTISGGTITSDGVTMNVSGFEGIGGDNGGLFRFADGTLVVDENGVATFL